MPSMRKSSRGSALLLSLILVLLASVSAVALALYVNATHRNNQRVIALEKASAAAEGGLHQTLHYFNKSGDIPSAQSSYATLIDSYFANGLDPAPIRSANMTFIDAASGVNADLIDYGKSRVTNLKVLSPRTGAATGTVFTFSSTATADTGLGSTVQRTALMDVAFDPSPRLVLPAAVIAGGSVSSNGHFNVHWGEAWAKNNAYLDLNRGNSKTAPVDQHYKIQADNNQSKASNDNWVVYRTAGYMMDSGGTKLVNNAAVNDVVVKPDGVNYWCTDNSRDGYIRNGHGILYQMEDVAHPADPLSAKIDATIDAFAATGNPNTGYEYWKQSAIRRDTYFRADASGAVLNGSGQRLYISNNVLNTAGTGSALTLSSAMDYYRWVCENQSADAYVVFFDTKDGNPPVTDGTKSNWNNISFTGSISNRSKGVFYVNGDLDIGGSGQPPSVTVKKPDDSTASLNVFHDGVVFTFGNYSYQGNPNIYGAIVCKGNYNGGGTPSIYYNIRLAIGDPQPLSTRARILGILIQ